MIPKGTPRGGLHSTIFRPEKAKISEELKAKSSPDIIFTHARHDLHQDHRLISDLTWNTYRNHLILEYEILKYDGDLGVPNLFVHLDVKTPTKLTPEQERMLRDFAKTRGEDIAELSKQGGFFSRVRDAFNGH